MVAVVLRKQWNSLLVYTCLVISYLVSHQERESITRSIEIISREFSSLYQSFVCAQHDGEWTRGQHAELVDAYKKCDEERLGRHAQSVQLCVIICDRASKIVRTIGELKKMWTNDGILAACRAVKNIVSARSG